MDDEVLQSNGTNFILLINTGTPEMPVFEAVAYQRDATVEESSETVDFSSKEQREQRVGYGRYSSTISLTKVFVPDEESYDILKAANREGTHILVAKEWAGNVFETAMAKIDSMSEAFPDQEAATISISMTVDGAWTPVGS